MTDTATPAAVRLPAPDSVVAPAPRSTTPAANGSTTPAAGGAAPSSPGFLDRLDPRLVAVAGALTIGTTPLFVALADASSATVTFFRCLLAVPLLLVLGLRAGVRWRFRPRHALAGLFLGLDMVLWSESIGAVGAGVATVMVNIQVVLVPLASLVLFRERVRTAFWVAVPPALGGVALAAGIGDAHAFGDAPVYGAVTGLLAGVAYAGYLLVLRRADEPGSQVTMLTTVNGAGALVALAAGIVTGTLDLVPSPSSFGWIAVLAVTGQILGWMLVGSAIRRLPGALGATLLLIQPVAAVVLAVVFLGETPSSLQLLGCGLVVAAVVAVTRTTSTPAARQAGRGRIRPRSRRA
ncbi:MULTISPECIES: DMT family transporter [Prauserella salsuginis group]|uniref:Drug/metabolite transporter (DMT)-like permease n=2 Tax=Prauserella salsuginis group TaxID=2893672 RepID=A0A839XMT3_9PSEU|nr:MULTISPECIES: DMT family transporter [Prauserella salsuginis group]MBB3661306.1 drug/metabolite transporter (DMT)-like permease [Prauserella sediminis]